MSQPVAVVPRADHYTVWAFPYAKKTYGGMEVG
jgi:hypothetical protein